jgi:hypothetical protein
MAVRPQGWLLPAAFYVAVLVAVVMATLPNPPHLPGDPIDKVQHVAAFAVLALLAAASYPRTPLLRIGERLSFLGALIEVVQSIPVFHRDCDIMDWVVDTAAIALVLVLVDFGRRAWREYRGANV